MVMKYHLIRLEFISVIVRYQNAGNDFLRIFIRSVKLVVIMVRVSMKCCPSYLVSSVTNKPGLHITNTNDTDVPPENRS